jgi:hypothetical protein
MALLEEDIQRMESLGFARERFAVESKGLVVLRNLHHRCFFHDGTRCTVYAVRPMGCRLYPVVYAEYSGTGALDRLCPFRDEFSLSSESKRGSAELFHRLIREARLKKARGMGRMHDPKGATFADYPEPVDERQSNARGCH